MDINKFGYGKNFQYDTQELFHSLKLYNYKPEFSLQTIVALQRHNIYNSLMDIKLKCFESWTRLFCFISSLGTEGYSTSTLFSEKYFYKISENKKIFSNSTKALKLINPNYNYQFGGGFCTFFVSSSFANNKERTVLFLLDLLKVLIFVCLNYSFLIILFIYFIFFKFFLNKKIFIIKIKLLIFNI